MLSKCIGSKDTHRFVFVSTAVSTLEELVSTLRITQRWTEHDTAGEGYCL